MGLEQSSSIDLYNLDMSLAKVIHKYLVEFRNMDRQCVIYKNMDETNKLLDELIWTFDTIANQGYTPELRELSEELHGADTSEDFSRKIKNLRNHPKYELYGQKTRETERRIDEGLKLFAKYFRSLWD